MPRTSLLLVSSLVVASAVAASASGQGLSERVRAVAEQRQEAAKNDMSRGRLLGALLYTDITANFENTPAKTAFEFIGKQLGVPFIVREHGGNPAIMGALGMLSGSCGTLVTPMAANFNLVPAILLGLPDRHAVIRAQAPMAAAMGSSIR